MSPNLRRPYRSQGGSAPNDTGNPTGNSGGGGGGGYWGGGAGGDGDNSGEGGGAGSSFWVSSATGTSMSEDTTGTPGVTISYTVTTSALAQQLVSASTGVGPGTALADKASAIQAAANSGQTATACSDITNYLGLVKAQTGKKLTANQAATLTTNANNLATALGCS